MRTLSGLPAPRFVLTAAHCAAPAGIRFGVENFRVITGDVNWKRPDRQGSTSWTLLRWNTTPTVRARCRAARARNADQGAADPACWPPHLVERQRRRSGGLGRGGSGPGPPHLSPAPGTYGGPRGSGNAHRWRRTRGKSAPRMPRRTGPRPATATRADRYSCGGLTIAGWSRSASSMGERTAPRASLASTRRRWPSSTGFAPSWRTRMGQPARRARAPSGDLRAPRARRSKASP